MAVNTFNDTFLRACRRESTSYTPVWFMRQAGRYMPEYRELRKKYDVLTLARTPELAAEVSLQPVRAMEVDAAILFADIMLVPIAMGIEVDIVDSVGPVIARPLRTEDDIRRLKPITADSIDYLRQTIKLLRGELKIPLIGFSGAPFTLASYLIEGRPSRSWIETKQFMYRRPDLWHRLMSELTEAIIFYLQQQAEAGVQALQLFDSWIGALSPSDFVQYVQPYNQRIFTALATTNVPRIIFGTNTSGLLAEFTAVDCEVVGLDWHVNLEQVRQQLPGRALQGNLDPVVLLAGWPAIQEQTRRVLQSAGDRQGYIFNLGHGLLPQTSPGDLKRLVDLVHDS